MPKRKRPKPPPSPPESLLQLLKSDKKVLVYFRSLKENLEADVQVWKDRAKRWERETTALKRGKKRGAPKRQTKNLSHTDGTERGPQEAKPVEPQPNFPNEIRLGNGPTAGVEIEDHMLDFSSDEEDNLVENSSIHDEIIDVDDLMGDFRDETHDDLGASHDFATYDELRKAHDLFDQLGVELVALNSTTTVASCDSSSDRASHHTTTSRKLVFSRRSDEEVCEDIFMLVRELARLHVHEGQNGEYFPFDLESGLPSFQVQGLANETEHPARAAHGMILTAFDILDRCCSSCLSDSVWSSLFGSVSNGQETSESMRVGLRGRKSLVDTFASSVEMQLKRSWPKADRSRRLTPTSVVFDSTQSSLSPISLEINSKCIPALAGAAERAFLASIFANVLKRRSMFDDLQTLIVDYLIATIPCLFLEECPKHAPNMSFVCLESLCDAVNEITEAKTLLAQEGIALCVAMCASVWSTRKTSVDDRIRCVACVELQAYKRLLQTAQWSAFDDIKNAKWAESLKSACHTVQTTESRTHLSGKLLQLLLVCVGDVEFILKEVVRTTMRTTLLPVTKAVKELCSRYKESNQDIENVSSLADGVLSPFMKRCDEIGIHVCLVAAVMLSNTPWIIQLTEKLIQKGSISDEEADCLVIAARTPVIWFINLEARRDRHDKFLARAIVHEVCAHKGVVRLDENGYETNGYAVDGRGSASEAYKRLVSFTGSKRQLDALLAPEWRPHDLKPFDKGAPDHEKLVTMSLSEQACALSHVSCWKAARDSLRLQSKPGGLRDSPHLLRLMTTCGFASGAALCHENVELQPTPVCLIMEDDAILVEGFREKLERILVELPRDFHFCSIGYSRPKTAPIVEFSTTIGVPSMLWYMTGYILSATGIEFLLNELPVTRPLDNWIGLKMTQNWDNSFGVQVGVGSHGRGGSVARKDLSKIMRFRAFCSSQPICRQRMERQSGLGHRDWRLRDTDIEYSGDSVPANG